MTDSVFLVLNRNVQAFKSALRVESHEAQMGNKHTRWHTLECEFFGHVPKQWPRLLAPLHFSDNNGMDGDANVGQIET